MFVCIHPNQRNNQFEFDSQRIINLLKFNDIKFQIVYAGDHLFWDQIRKCDLFIFQWSHRDYFRQIAHAIIPIIENKLNIKCFPNHLSSWLYDDKIRQYYLLKAAGFPIVKSWVFYDMHSALNFFKSARFPMVFKLKSGAGSKMVRLIRNRKESEKYTRLMFKKGVPYKKGLPGTMIDEIKINGLLRFFRIKAGALKQKLNEGANFIEQNWMNHQNYIYLQHFLPHNEFDTRVVTIGKRAFAFKRYNLSDDFRASGSLKADFEPAQIDLGFIEIGLQISHEFNFDTMAYDFIYDENGKPAIVEISYNFGSAKGSKISNCPGYWDEKLNWHEEQAEVAYWILSDLLREHRTLKRYEKE